MNDKHINDGGPAFPVADTSACQVGSADELDAVARGMTLRDYFAARMMQGLLANPGGPIQANGMNGWNWCNCSPEDVVCFAYSIADTMLKVRGGKT